MKPQLGQQDYDAIIDYLEECQHDPELFVKLSFPWGEPNTPLENQQGPEEWQRQILREIKDNIKTAESAIREAVASGHGIGKSALVSWIILWALGTCTNTRGVVTANTETQLRTKTWAELSKWYNMWEAKSLFDYTATSIFCNADKYEKTWRIDAIPWSETNSEAFAGLHNQGNRILIIFDEASAIHDTIWEVTEGALTDADTEIIWCCFGNPTRSSGRFYDCFHKHRNYWHTRRVDSRSVSFSDKKQIEAWREIYGEDSDFFKVRVRGEFPSASDKQYISQDIVDEARKRVLKPYQYNFAPVIIGVDPAWTGADKISAYLRQGNYCKLLFEYPKNDNDLQLAGKIAALEDEYHADAVFIDLGYGTGIKSAGDAWGRNWTLVSFGSTKGIPPNCVNKRAAMWQDMRHWAMQGGAIPPDDNVLADDLVGPELVPRDDGRVQLESKESMKKRGLPSPNRGDALALTFAFPVLSRKQEHEYAWSVDNGAQEEYDPFHGMW